MLPYRSILKLDSESKLPIYNKIANAIITLISNGTLTSGSRLPSSRQLATILKVHRKTVVAAYDELLAQGWIQTRGRAGTFVHNELPLVRPPKSSNLPSSHSQDEMPTNSYLITLDDGYPDIRMAPSKSLSREYSSLLKNKNFVKSLNYTWEFRGDYQLRKEICVYLRDTRGIYVGTDQVLVSRGSIMSFYLAINTFLNPGDHVVVAFPGYQTFNEIVKNRGGHVEHVAVDEDGLCVDEIEHMCKKFKVAFVYAISHHHHPTTVTLSAERRLKLVTLSKKYNFKIIEDDYDYDFHYESSPVLPLASLPHDNTVFYVGSFSKTVAPSLRLGFIVTSSDRILKMAQTRRYIDRTGDPVLERAVAHLLKFGEIRRHLNKALKAYRNRRDLMCQLLKSELKDYISFVKPEGGLAIWVTFKDGLLLDRVLMEAEKRGLHFNLPSYYKVDYQTRFGFASLNEEEIITGINLLKQSILALNRSS